MDTLKIAAVVITYNRLELLKECIESLRNQTRKLDEIIVVNNDSTDGTKEWLNNQKDLTVISQANLGGAGGFHTGIKTAYEKGYDWIWCMDDDGFADKDCLNSLLLYTNDKFNIVGPFVINKTDNTKLAFKCPCIIETDDTEKLSFDRSYVLSLFPNIINDWVVLFNGVLISKDVMSIIGFPLKELFIWGDEFEYLRRIIRKGFQYYTVTNAIFYHPAMKLKTCNYLFGKKIVVDFTKEQKYYYFFRNLGYLSKEDYRFYNIKYLISQFLYYLTPKRFKPGLSYFFLHSYFKGIFLKL